MRPILLGTHICRDYVQAVDIDVTPSKLLFRKNLNPADSLERVKTDPSQIFARTVIPDGASLRRGNKAEITDHIFGGQLNPVRILTEGQSRLLFGV
jgi:hypothetical protein